MKKILVLSLVALSMLSTSCKKNPPNCFFEAVYLKHKDDVCPFGCTNVTGCDEKIYCNECEANKVGIRIKQ